MFNSAILDVAIGLVFLFCLISVGASMVRESIEALLKTRSIMLEQGIRELLGESQDNMTAAAGGTVDSLTRDIFDHPQISGLFSGNFPEQLTPYRWFPRSAGRLPFRNSLPSYIPSRNFALALLDRIGRGPVGAPAAAGTPGDVPLLDLGAIRTGIRQLSNEKLRRALLVSLDDVGDLQSARQAVEKWYDSAMDRVSGWYRRETQAILLVIGLALAVLLNIDAVAVGQRLLVDEPWRNTVVAAAMTEAKKDQTGSDQSVAALEEQLRDNGFMIGAPLRPTKTPLEVVGVQLLPAGKAAAFAMALPGYLVIALATSLGGPFWFDLLNRLIVIRSTVKPHEKSGEEGSKERADTSEDDSGGGGGGGSTPSAPRSGGGGGTLTAEDLALLDLDPASRPREGG